MAHPSEAEFVEFDDANEAHLALKSVSPLELMQVFRNDPLWAANKRNRTAAWLMIGRTDGGRAIVAAVIYNEVRSSVRPITARTCTPAEESKWLS